MVNTKLFAISALAALTTATPIALETRQYSNTTTNPSVAPAPAPNPILLPTSISLWNSGTSKVTYDTTYPLVQRNQGTWGDISTLLTFNIPSQYAMNTCEAFFTLPSGYTVSGSGQAQIFHNNKGASAGATSNSRDVQLATMKAVAGGNGLFGTVDGSGMTKTAFTFPCGQFINAPYFEVAPRGESVSFYWPKGEGFKIRVISK